MKTTSLFAILLLSLLSSGTAFWDNEDYDDDEVYDIHKAMSFIVNGTESQLGRYPWYTSLRQKMLNGNYSHTCGASLITDRLILTAAHCVRSAKTLNNSRSAFPEDFEKLGLNFTAFPNTYVKFAWDRRYAFVGAQGFEVKGIEPNEVVLWHVHPQYYYQSTYADIAVGLLAKPVKDLPKVKVLSSSTDVYQLIGLTQPLHAIGLGDYVSDYYSDVLAALNLTDGKINGDPSKKLQEADVGSLLPRVVCGIANTVGSLSLKNDGSGNYAYNRGLGHPVIIPESQICVTPASDAHVQEYIEYVEHQLVKGFQLMAIQQNTTLSDEEVLDEITPIFDFIPSTSGACQGDSGGPLIIKGDDHTTDIQIGLTSYGLGCGHPLGGMWTNIQSFLQGAENGFDDWLWDVLNQYPDELPLFRTAPGIPSRMASIAARG